MLPLTSAKVMAPVGQTRTQVPHPMQELDAMWNGGLTSFSMPRLMVLIAPAPSISRQARTQRAHRIQASCGKM